MILLPPRSTPLYSSAASDVYKRQAVGHGDEGGPDCGGRPYRRPARRRTPSTAASEELMCEQRGPGPGCDDDGRPARAKAWAFPDTAAGAGEQVVGMVD